MRDSAYLTRQRNREISAVCMKLIKQRLEANTTVVMTEVAKEASTHPSSRFWVSEERASAVVNAWNNHDLLGKPYPYWADPESMSHERRKMFSEIYSRFKILRQRSRYKYINDIVSRVISSPAPSFYITEKSILVYFYTNLQKHRLEVREKISKK